MTSRTTAPKVDRAAIRARIAAASPAPWAQEPHTYAGSVWVRMGHSSDLEPNTLPAVESMRKRWDYRRLFRVRSHHDSYRLTREEVYAQREADAAFVANARQDLPAVLDENEALTERAETAEATIVDVLARLDSLQAALPANRTDGAHGAIEVIAEIRGILDGPTR